MTYDKLNFVIFFLNVYNLCRIIRIFANGLKNIMCMKHFLFSILLLFCSFTASNGQNAENRLAEIINSSDWFLLDTEYPSLKDSIQYDFLNTMAEAMLAHYFNKPAEAVELLRTLVNEYQGVLGNDATWSFISLVLYDLERCQDYATAATKVKALIEQVKLADASADCKQFEEVYQKYMAFSHYDSTLIERKQPYNNSVIPLVEEYTDGRFSRYSVPVTDKGKTYRFLCSGAPVTCLSKKLARELECEDVGYGNYVYLDSLHVGDIVFRHVIAQVSEEGTDEMDMAGVDAIMGLDLIQRLGEIQVDNVRKEMLIPFKPSPMPAYGRNMCGDGYSYFLKVGGKSVALSDLLNSSTDALRNIKKVVINFNDMFFVYE